MRRGYRPQLLRKFKRGAGNDTLLGARFRYDLTLRVQNPRHEDASLGSGVLVPDPSLYLNCAALRADFRRVNKRPAFVISRTLKRNRQPVAEHEPHIPVNAAVEVEIARHHRRNTAKLISPPVRNLYC